jgi:hypothetical protein
MVKNGNEKNVEITFYPLPHKMALPAREAARSTAT